MKEVDKVVTVIWTLSKRWSKLKSKKAIANACMVVRCKHHLKRKQQTKLQRLYKIGFVVYLHVKRLKN